MLERISAGRRERRRVWASTLFALLVTPLLSAQRAPTAAELLSRYAAGQFDEATAPLRPRFKAQADVDQFVDQLRRETDKWPGELSAAFALEAAAIQLREVYLHPASFLRDPRVSLQLLDLGAVAMRRGTADDFAVRWHAAVIALLTGPPDERWAGSSVAPFAHDMLEIHYGRLSSARREQPQIAMAWGVSRDVLVQRYFTVEGASKKIWADRPVPASERQIHKWLSDAARAFTAAARDPALEAEATLRLGLVALYQDRTTEAFDRWAKVASSSHDDALRYLALMFTGRTLLALEKFDEAAVALKQALAIVPDAQSAMIPFATLRFLSGQRDDASGMVESLLRAPTMADDPWWRFTDSRWLAHLDAVRERAR